MPCFERSSRRDALFDESRFGPPARTPAPSLADRVPRRRRRRRRLRLAAPNEGDSRRHDDSVEHRTGSVRSDSTRRSTRMGREVSNERRRRSLRGRARVRGGSVRGVRGEGSVLRATRTRDAHDDPCPIGSFSLSPSRSTASRRAIVAGSNDGDLGRVGSRRCASSSRSTVRSSRTSDGRAHCSGAPGAAHEVVSSSKKVVVG